MSAGMPRQFVLISPLAFLHAYIDDSASEQRDRRLFMAGYLNRAEAWALFSDAWHEELQATPSIDYLKMAEANSLRGQFDRRKGWTKQKRDEKLHCLASVISHSKPMLSFEISLSLACLNDLLKPVSPRGLGNPHFLCGFGIVAGLAGYMDSQKIKTPIDFIFDQQEGVDANIRLFFDYMKRNLPRGARRLIRHPIFEDEKDRQFLPLQAADMLAWHVRREHEDCTPPERLPLAILLRADSAHLKYEIGEAVIKRLSDHHSKLTDVSQLQSKAQWGAVRREIERLFALGIDPSTIGRRKNIYQRACAYIARLFH
jgi:hypothetical protein